MDLRKFESGASASPPTAPVSPSSGYATKGNPATPIPPTVPGEYWFHQIAEELRAVIVAGGVTPDHTALDQLLTALRKQFGYRRFFHLSEATPQTIPNGDVLTKLNLGTTTYNELGDSTIASSAVTIGTADAGIWVLAAQGNVNVGVSEQLALRLNSDYITNQRAPSGGDSAVQSLATVRRLAAGDVLSLYFSHADSTSKNTTGIGYMVGVRVGP